MTVRFPSGQAVTYNDAMFMQPFAGGWHLYKSRKKTQEGYEYEGWIATVQAEGGAIIEAVPPCKVENPLMQVTGESALLYVLAHVEDLAKLSKGARLLADLKKKLGGFSLRYRRFS